MPDITLEQKSLLATIILVLALVQLVSIITARGWIFTAPLKLRLSASRAHRVGGYVGLVLIFTIAYYCVFGIGANPDAARTVVHAFLGAVSVVMVSSKLLVARLFKKQYGKLPVMGAILGIAVGITWATSALWYYMTF